MAVVVAQAMVAENQVRLTKVQSQLQAAKAQHSAEQLQVGQMETPSRITRMAQQQHLATPSQIQQVPSVPLSRPISPPKVAPSSGAAPSTAAGG